MGTRNNESNNESSPFVEIALASLGSVIVPVGCWGAAFWLYADSHDKGYYGPGVEDLMSFLIAAGFFPGIPAGVMIGVAIAERGEY